MYQKGVFSTGRSPKNYAENINGFVVLSRHNHEQVFDEATKKEKLESMKRLIETTGGSVRATVSQALRGCNADIIGNVGNLECLYKILRNHRNSYINPPPYICEELKLSLKLCNTFRNEVFYQYGPGNFGRLIQNNDICIFYSQSMVAKLRENDLWCVDGTFKVVPRPYTQLYTISFIKSVHVFPVIYCVLKNKREETYNSLWKILKDLNGNFSPVTIKTDFELASINAIRRHFPRTNISGCQFHLNQAIIRKLKEENLFNIYKTNTNVKKYIKALTALSYVDFNQVIATFVDLMESPSYPQTLRCIYNYFYDTYICSTSAIYPPSLWNSQSVLHGIPKTNNAIEAWHMVFNSTFGTSKFNFKLLAFKLKEEEEVIQQKLIRIELGERFPRNRRYVDMENALFNFIVNSRTRSGLPYVFSLVNLLFY